MFLSKGWKSSQFPSWRQSSRGSPLLRRGSAFSLLFYSGLLLLGWGPPTLGRAACLPQPTDPNVNLMQKPLTDTPRIALASYLATLWPSQVETQNEPSQDLQHRFHLQDSSFLCLWHRSRCWVPHSVWIPHLQQSSQPPTFMQNS